MTLKEARAKAGRSRSKLKLSTAAVNLRQAQATRAAQTPEQRSKAGRDARAKRTLIERLAAQALLQLMPADHQLLESGSLSPLDRLRSIAVPEGEHDRQLLARAIRRLAGR